MVDVRSPPPPPAVLALVGALRVSVRQGQPSAAAEARAAARRAGGRSQGDEHAAQAYAVGELSTIGQHPLLRVSLSLRIPYLAKKSRPYRDLHT